MLALLLCLWGTTYGQDASPDDEGGEEVPSSADLLDQTEGAPTDAQQRELEASENPLENSTARREATRSVEEVDRDKEPAASRTTGFDLYGSLRVRYRENDGETDWQDGGSRAGLELDWQYREGYFGIFRYEFGFNLLTGLEDLNPGKESAEEFQDSVFKRLRYVGLDTPRGQLLFGKNWSTYYAVSGFTDRFMGTGGAGSGTYNAQTDGGPTGPGRADRALQTNLSTDFLPHTRFDPFDINVQVQHGNPIPFGAGIEYGAAVGISAVMKMKAKNLSVGLAYNHATIDLDANPSLRSIGITGDARATMLGLRGFGNNWYAGWLLARLENHETTDQGVYFDGWGSELYTQYRLSKHLWLIGGYNVLEPDSDETQAGEYRVRYAVAGLRYTLGDDFTRMIWANVQFDDGRAADGSRAGNTYTIGIRWDLAKRGWHALD